MADLVPTIDLEPWWHGDDEARHGLAAAVDGACRTVGFLRITGHGVRPSLVERMLAVTSEFFDLPEEEKRRCAPPRPGIDRGYAAGHPDLFEAFTMGVDRWPRGDPYYECQRGGRFAPNIWPTHPIVLCDVWVEYFDAVQELADWLMEIFAVALGLPEGYLAQRCSRAPDVMRANNYERRPGAAAPLRRSDAHGRPRRRRRLHRPARRCRARAADHRARRGVARRAARARHASREPRRAAGGVDERPVARHRAPGRAAPGRPGGSGPAPVDRVRPRGRPRRRAVAPAHVSRSY